MDYRTGEDRASRRARYKPIQSCEIVGILPKEEAALNRALHASLIQASPKAKENDTNPAPKIKEELNESATDILCNRLSSPDFCEQDDEGATLNNGPASLPSSRPSTPNSYHSNNSLHLFLSSSSWTSSDSSSSSESSFSSWSPDSTSELPERVKTKNKKKQSKKTSVKREVKRVLEFCADNSEERTDVVGGKKHKANHHVDQRTVPRVEKKPVSKDVATDASRGNSFQAQRKFAANHTPPVRLTVGKVKAVRGLKELPKTEDVITYLCLRGSHDIPQHLRRFESPWTSLIKKRKKVTKAKRL